MSSRPSCWTVWATARSQKLLSPRSPAIAIALRPLQLDRFIEHGAQGGDELNRPEKGKNYGWPVITYGRDYSGASIGEGSQREGMEQPVSYWDTVIAASGESSYAQLRAVARATPRMTRPALTWSSVAT